MDNINSIKKSLKEEENLHAVNVIKLISNANKKRKFIIVEGKDDKKFLKQFITKNNELEVYEAEGGCKNVEEIVGSKILEDTNVIGIRDKDYCKNKYHKNIYFYDKCCLEMMLISFDEIFYNMCVEFCEPIEEKYSDYRKHILSELYGLSMLRKYNYDHNLNISFSGIVASKYIEDYNNYAINYDKLICDLEKCNKEKSLDKIMEKVKIEYSNKNFLDIDYLLDVTNGHDFISVFNEICKKINKSRAIKDREKKDDSVSICMRSNCSIELFSKTNLYNDIKFCFGGNVSIWDK